LHDLVRIDAVSTRLLWGLAAAAIAAFIFIQSSRPSLTLQEGPTAVVFANYSQSDSSVDWDELAHTFVHLGLFAALAFCAHRTTRPLSLKTAVLVAGAVALYGLSDEYHQSFVAARDGSLWDVIVDSIGAVAGALTSFWAARIW
jgi:VanZ family protein